MRVSYKRAAVKDMEATRDYIAGRLKNPKAAKKLMAALLKSQGTTVFVENIFESRYRHVAELQRMGADIRLEGRVAVVCGVSSLHGAMVQATDLRGGAALVVAGLQTGGTTLVGHIHHIERGYSDFVENLARLGARIRTTDT